MRCFEGILLWCMTYHKMDCRKCIMTLSSPQVRHYSSARWVSTDVKSHLLDIAQVTGFLRLYKYINGANVDGEATPS